MFTKELVGLSGIANLASTTKGATEIALKNAIWTIFGVVGLIFIVFSLSLLYHWHRYGLKSRRIIMAEIIYFVVAAAIIFMAFISLVFA